jgi:hypothetical protein
MPDEKPPDTGSEVPPAAPSAEQGKVLDQAAKKIMADAMKLTDEQIKGLVAQVQRVALPADVLMRSVEAVLKQEIRELLDVHVTDVRCEHKTGAPMLDIYIRLIPKGALGKLAEVIKLRGGQKKEETK